MSYRRRVFVLAVLGGACSASPDGPLAIAGSYVDPFGTAHQITDTEWVQSYGSTVSAFSIVSYDNASQHAIAQNDEGNPYNPSLWSRFDWLEVDGVFSVCQTTFDAPSEQDAEEVPRADEDLAGGCGGFPWSELSPL